MKLYSRDLFFTPGCEIQLGNRALKGGTGASEKARLMSSDPDGFDTKRRKERVWGLKLNPFNLIHEPGIGLQNLQGFL